MEGPERATREGGDVVLDAPAATMEIDHPAARHTVADLRLARHAVGVHEAGHCAFIVHLGAGRHIDSVRLVETRRVDPAADLDCRVVTGAVRHHLGFPPTWQGRLAGTAFHVSGVWAARMLLPDPSHPLCVGSCALAGSDAAAIERFAPTPRERLAADRWAIAVVNRWRLVIPWVAEELAAREEGELSGDEVRTMFRSTTPYGKGMQCRACG